MIKALSVPVLLLIALCVNGQQIVNVQASYKNDTLIITYDYRGKHNIDSLEIKILSTKTRERYNICFEGDANKDITSGKEKRAYAYIHRDSFPDNGENLKIQLKGWAKSSKSSSKRRKKGFKLSLDLSKVPKNPRFSITSSLGIILPSSEFSDLGHKSSFLFLYQASPLFQIGIGIAQMAFIDTLRSFSTFPGSIVAKYELKYWSPAYILMKYGFSIENNGAAFSFGFGYKKLMYGRFGLDINAQLQKFSGYREFVAMNLNAGLSVNASSRRRYKRDKVYKFNSFLFYAEGGVNYFQKLTPNFSFDIAYNISPFYTQGIGVSFESINYEQTIQVKRPYFSAYYNEFRQIIISENTYTLNLKIVPIYFSGRLFFASGKFRPYLLWKYGFTIYSDTNKGKLKNGFVADFGFGLQVPVNKSKAINLSGGIKFFNNKYSYEGNTNTYFGTLFIKSGFVF